MASIRVESESWMSAARVTRLSAPAPDIAGEKAEGHADRSLDDDGEHADDERDARAVENGAEQIPALRVGAEQEARVAAGEPGAAAGRRRAHRSSRGRTGSAVRSAGASATATAMMPSTTAAMLHRRRCSPTEQTNARGARSRGRGAHRVPSRLMRGIEHEAHACRPGCW